MWFKPVLNRSVQSLRWILGHGKLLLLHYMCSTRRQRKRCFSMHGHGRGQLSSCEMFNVSDPRQTERMCIPLSTERVWRNTGWLNASVMADGESPDWLAGWLLFLRSSRLRNWLYGWFVWLALDSPPSASKRTKPQSTQTHPTLGSVCTLAPQSVDINERPREYVFTLRLYHKHFCQNQKHLMK